MRHEVTLLVCLSMLWFASKSHPADAGSADIRPITLNDLLAQRSLKGCIRVNDASWRVADAVKVGILGTLYVPVTTTPPAKTNRLLIHLVDANLASYVASVWSLPADQQQSEFELKARFFLRPHAVLGTIESSPNEKQIKAVQKLLGPTLADDFLVIRRVSGSLACNGS